MDFEKRQNLDTLTITISVCEFNVAANGNINFNAVHFAAFPGFKWPMFIATRPPRAASLYG